MEFADPEAHNKRQLEAMMAPALQTEERPTKRRPSNPAAANQRHIKTEQARRDKIAAGFQALQDLLPGRERVEKALLLNQAASYISQLQAVLAAILTNGTITKLPDELQWQIRSLLPRKEPTPRLPMPVLNQAGLQSNPFPAPSGGEAGQQVTPQASGGSAMQGKEMSKDENVLMAQVQAQLQNMQQQAQAAQQIQSWQQALQAFQLQQVLTQQQQHGGPQDLTALAPFSSIPPPAAPMPVFKTAPSSEAPGNIQDQQPQTEQPAGDSPEGTFTELLARDPAAQTPAESSPAVQQDADSNAGDFSNKTAQANVSKPKKTASKAKKPTGSSKGKEELGEES